MTLRRKLLLVALCTLALPVAGWLYVRQMEALLRQGQAQALIASARAVARSLVVTNVPLPTGDKGWYVQRAVNPITVDGYGFLCRRRLGADDALEPVDRYARQVVAGQ